MSLSQTIKKRINTTIWSFAINVLVMLCLTGLVSLIVNLMFLDSTDPFKKPWYYTYKLIETLLPKAMNSMPKEKTNEEHGDTLRKIKMVELWAPNDCKRKGWLKVKSLSGE
jgi:hypothetical protein